MNEQKYYGFQMKRGWENDLKKKYIYIYIYTYISLKVQ